jgi:hypothetical protein
MDRSIDGNMQSAKTPHAATQLKAGYGSIQHQR